MDKTYLGLKIGCPGKSSTFFKFIILNYKNKKIKKSPRFSQRQPVTVHSKVVDNRVLDKTYLELKIGCPGKSSTFFKFIILNYKNKKIKKSPRFSQRQPITIHSKVVDNRVLDKTYLGLKIGCPGKS